MGKRLFTFAANAPLRLLGLAAVIAACGGSTDPTMPETSVSRTSPGGAGDPGAPTVGTAPLPTPGPDHVADNVGAPAAITMTKDMVVFITRKTTIDDKLVDAGALFVADKKVGRAMMTGLDRQGATYEALATDGQCLIGALAISDVLRRRGASGSHATVYRVLDELHGLGLVRRVNDEQGVALYEIADPGAHHHHIVDEDTGAVRPFEDHDLERAIRVAAERAGIELTGHDVVLRGRRRAAR